MIKRLICATLCVSTVQAMVFDNRFLPLLLKPFTRRSCDLGHIRLQPFFMQADQAFSSGFRLEIPDLCTTYDQAVLARTFVEKGLDNPLRSDFLVRPSIKWQRKGRLDAQGLAFLYEQPLTNWWSVGINTLFGHVAIRHQFLLTGAESNLPQGDKNYLLQSKEAMHEALGICPPVFSRIGFGDTDLYMRFGGIWHYPYKFRRIDFSMKCGLLIPSAQERDLSNPASIPFGGNKHWGIYGGFESDVELKEDFSVGLMFRAMKRFERTSCLRMPLLSEPPEYGSIAGQFCVDPGWTFVFNPHVTVSGIRDGFGVTALYTLIAHLDDTIIEKRPSSLQRSLPANTQLVECCSSWGSEYVSIGAFYDFGKVRDCPTLYPKISLYWDIPVDWLVSKRAAQTNSVSLMLEFDF